MSILKCQNDCLLNFWDNVCEINFAAVVMVTASKLIFAACIAAAKCLFTSVFTKSLIYRTEITIVNKEIRYRPYIPGCVDIMTEYSKDGLFFRLYYPTNEKSPIQSYIKDWLPWIPYDSYLRGFARVVMLWLFVVRLTFWFIAGNLHIPAVQGAKIRKNEKLKCIILSHGLGGSRFLYSATCIELASRGFLVAAIEHRDDTAANTCYYKSVEDVKQDKKTYINYVPVKLGPNHYDIRNSQVTKREEECTKLIKLILKINSGDIPYNILKDLPTQPSRNDFILDDLKDLIDVDDLTMMGHSFGAATSLLTIHKNKQLLRRGIILDPWMFPIKDMTELTEITQPLIFINTQTFHISSNVKIMDQFIAKNEKIRPVYTILHTTHENQSDSVFAFGSWLNLFLKKLSGENAMKINNCVILSFLNKEMKVSVDMSDCDKYLLEQSENYVLGIDALKNLIKIQYKTVFKMFDS